MLVCGSFAGKADIAGSILGMRDGVFTTLFRAPDANASAPILDTDYAIRSSHVVGWAGRGPQTRWRWDPHVHGPLAHRPYGADAPLPSELAELHFGKGQLQGSS